MITLNRLFVLYHRIGAMYGSEHCVGSEWIVVERIERKRGGCSVDMNPSALNRARRCCA